MRATHILKNKEQENNLAYFKRLKDLREDNDKTQKEIADYLGMKQPQYSRYENGLRDIPSDILIMLADYYNVSTDYIFGRTNNPKISE